MATALITGASGGIGREFARQLLCDYGVESFIFVARNADRLRALGDELSALRDGVKVELISADLSTVEGVGQVEKHLEDTRPEIDYLINAAGFGRFGNFYEVPIKDTAAMIDLNAKALVLMTCAVAPYMKRGGRIIQLGSGSAFTPLPTFNVYAATKAFVVHYSKALNYELRPYGVRCTCFCPGWVETDFIDTAIKSGVSMPKREKIKPLLNAEKITRGCLKAAKRGKAMYVTGKFTKLQHVLYKLVPDPILTKQWLRWQK